MVNATVPLGGCTARSVRYAGLGFGLSRSQHFAECRDTRGLPFMGDVTVALDDPAGAIDHGALRAGSEISKCMAGSAAGCRIVTTHHVPLAARL